jgi:hypothetical protein
VGDAVAAAEASEYMPLCASCNRAKSWSCEHCRNWIEAHDDNICKKCYWASPESYTHVAMQELRRLDLVWQGKQVSEYEHIAKIASSQGTPLPEFVKAALRRIVRKSGE